MDDDLAKEIARIEAELVQDAELRHQQQQQQQQQQPNASAAATPASMFGFSAATSQPPSQPVQGGGFGVNSGSVNVALPQAQLQQPQLAPFQPLSSSTVTGVASSEIGSLGASQSGSANPPPHHFSKDSDGRSIFVGNLPKGENGGVSTTSEELASFFADCGQILNCTLLRDRVTHELKGTAYIEFASYSAMGQAIDTKNNADYKGHTIIVTRKRSNFKPERARGGRGALTAAGGNFRGRGGSMSGGVGSNAMNMVSPDPYQAIAALMGMMVGNTLGAQNTNNANFMRGGRGGRGGFGRGRGRGRGGTNYNNMNENEGNSGSSILGGGIGNNPNVFQPY